MNYLLLFLTILAVFLQSIMQKEFNKKTKNRGAYIFNSIASLFAAIVFLLSDKDGFCFQKALIPYVIAFGILFATAVLFIFLAIREGSLSLTSLLKSYSLLVPTFFGVFYFHENISIVFSVGLVFLVVSILLINMKKEDTKMSMRWWIYILILFVANGSASVVQLLQQKNFLGQYKSEFMMCALLLSSAIFFLLSMFAERKCAIECVKSGGLYAMSMGVLLGLANLLLMTLISSDMPSSIIYPVMSGGGVLIAALGSVIIYKEKLTIAQTIGIASGVVSIVLMNL